MKVKTFLRISFGILLLALTGLNYTQCSAIATINPLWGVLAFITAENFTIAGIIIGYLYIKKGRNLEEEL